MFRVYQVAVLCVQCVFRLGQIAVLCVQTGPGSRVVCSDFVRHR